jgi:3',5'-cyclic-AMP phosphodiesterase
LFTGRSKCAVMGDMDVAGCCGNGSTRRQALLWASLLASAPLVAESSARADSSGLLVRDVEVVTVTDTTAVITWFTGSSTATDSYGQPLPVPADTELLLGDVDPATGFPMPSTLKPVLHDTTPTAYHYAEVTGLEPGRPYSFAALSNGIVASQTSIQFPVGVGGSQDIPGTFTTLATPPGRHLFTIALSNDLHIGEAASGIIAANWPPFFQQDPGLPPYPEVMLGAVLGDLSAADRNAQALIVAGDLTGDGLPAESARARQLLDGWGTLNKNYFVARGNHDRPRVGAAYAGCTVVPGASDHHDCWGDAFGLRRQELAVHELGGLRIVALDTTTLDAAGGTLEASQLAQFKERLHKDRDRPTLLFGHHPITYESAVTTPAGPGFDIDRPSAVALQRLYQRTPGVFLHHSGHTHRNKRTFFVDENQAPQRSVEFLEVGAVKEYPGGYSLLRVYSGGYMVSFYKTRTPLAQAWSHRTRGEYFGLYPNCMLGTIADRNHTVVRDLSGLRPLA